MTAVKWDPYRSSFATSRQDEQCRIRVRKEMFFQSLPVLYLREEVGFEDSGSPTKRIMAPPPTALVTAQVNPSMDVTVETKRTEKESESVGPAPKAPKQDVQIPFARGFLGSGHPADCPQLEGLSLLPFLEERLASKRLRQRGLALVVLNALDRINPRKCGVPGAVYPQLNRWVSHFGRDPSRSTPY